MSNLPEKIRAPSLWSSNQPNTPPFDPDPLRTLKDKRSESQPRGMATATSPGPSRFPDRPNFPTRSSTVDSPRPDRNFFNLDQNPHAHSEDLNHGSSEYFSPIFSGSPRSSPSPSPTRPKQSASPKPLELPSSSKSSVEDNGRLSTSSFTSAKSGSSKDSDSAKPAINISRASSSLTSA
jgi:hypothetical protein